MIRVLLGTLLAASIMACAIASIVQAQEGYRPITPDGKTYSPYPEESFPNKVLFGDTHLHTKFSFDAGMFGNTLGPDEAYRFARGEVVISTTGQKARLRRPLDFLVVTDHAENLGVAPMIAQADPLMQAIPFGAELIAKVKAGDLPGAWNALSVAKAKGKDPFENHPEIYKSSWQRITESAERHYTPGLFTALIGFEWSSTYDRSNLHRNVIFRGGKKTADTIVPFSQYDSANPEDLWTWMERYEAKTGDRLLAIPHNGNLSNGLMFDLVKLGTNEPLDAKYVTRRARFEPIYEVTQMKGDGETHPMLSPKDEFADFETWDKGQLGPALKKPEMIPKEYAREALKRGLWYETKLGTNPYKFGLIGSTDSHTSLSTPGEDNFFGKFVGAEPTADPLRFSEVVGGVGGPKEAWQYTWQTSASGLAAVWARENTREAIFDALIRKEVFATTGPRIRVRFFAGWEFTHDDLSRSDFARNGYSKGVPMGGDLTAAPPGKAPTFLIRAIRDVDGANLDRIQIVKGWLDRDGKTHERIYDLACSDGRKITSKNRCNRPVGNTVKVTDVIYNNSIGAAAMHAHWKDPNFDPSERAFYYIRVLEIPTPRWSTYDTKFFGVKLPEGAPTSIQERAYTSPIWYTPQKGN